MNKDLMEALDLLEKEKGIKKDVIIQAIKNSLLAACQKNYGKSDNIVVNVNADTGDFDVAAQKTVVEQVNDDLTEISLPKALAINSKASLGDLVNVPIKSQEFSRVVASNAKSVIQQKIREEEKNLIFNQYYEKERNLVTGVVQKIDDNDNIYVNLGKIDAVLTKKEQVPGEVFQPTERIKLYIVEVRNDTRSMKVIVSRTHPEIVKRLFEAEVTEIKSGVVEIKAVSREAGSRTKMAVCSHDSNVDPVGACVGVNGARVNAVVDELRGEKIDIINWVEDPAVLIANALSPAKVVNVTVYDDNSAEVIVPDDQLSLAIGLKGQNARLAAKLTGYKIDIKKESDFADGSNEEYYDDPYEVLDAENEVEEVESNDEE
ncbi:MAG: transcription termination factor NusA [Lachnospiraceae bacterium]|nr:transcription termination factor NusA [Lachnospiraceae bacterium]